MQSNGFMPLRLKAPFGKSQCCKVLVAIGLVKIET